MKQIKDQMEGVKLFSRNCLATLQQPVANRGKSHFRFLHII